LFFFIILNDHLVKYVTDYIVIMF